MSNPPSGVSNGDFSNGLTSWTQTILGGEDTPGAVRNESEQAVILEGDSFLVTLSQTFVVSSPLTSLSFDMFFDPGFDVSDRFIPDAFEAQLLDDQARPVVPPWNKFATSFFNVQEDGTVYVGDDAAAQPLAAGGLHVVLDLSGVPAGTTVTLFFDLIGADADTGSGITIDNVGVTGTCGEIEPTTDCNGNGIDDACEIETGVIDDCNQNGIPDECDITNGLDGVAVLNSSSPVWARTSLATERQFREATCGDEGGPVLIGGDDADDHGYRNVRTNQNRFGWLYIQDGFRLIGPRVRNGNKLAICLGCRANNAIVNALTAFVAGFLYSGLPEQGWDVAWIDGEDTIDAFFTNRWFYRMEDAGIIYMPTTAPQVRGGINGPDLATVSNHADALAEFVDRGGGLFVHEQDPKMGGFRWLKELLPNATFPQMDCHDDRGHCEDRTLSLTPAGTVFFPDLTDAIISNATPWHRWFDGEFGGLEVLVTGRVDGVERPVVLGGAKVSLRRRIVLDPSSAMGPVNTFHTVTAQVADGSGEPLPGVHVLLEVIAGPNAGVSLDSATDENGQATFRYAGVGGEGVDDIIASFADAEDGAHCANTVQMTWRGSLDCDDNGVPDECQGAQPGDCKTFSKGVSKIHPIRE